MRMIEFSMRFFMQLGEIEVFLMTALPFGTVVPLFSEIPWLALEKPLTACCASLVAFLKLTLSLSSSLHLQSISFNKILCFSIFSSREEILEANFSLSAVAIPASPAGQPGDEKLRLSREFNWSSCLSIILNRWERNSRVLTGIITLVTPVSSAISLVPSSVDDVVVESPIGLLPRLSCCEGAWNASTCLTAPSSLFCINEHSAEKLLLILTLVLLVMLLPCSFLLASVVFIFTLNVPAICLVGPNLGSCAPVSRHAALATRSGEALESEIIKAGVDVLMGARLLCGLGVSVGVLIGARPLCGLRVFIGELMGARLLCGLRVLLGVLRRRCENRACALVFAVLVRTAGDFLVDGGW